MYSNSAPNTFHFLWMFGVSKQSQMSCGLHDEILEKAASKQDRIAPSMCQRIHCWMGEPASWVPTNPNPNQPKIVMNKSDSKMFLLEPNYHFLMKKGLIRAHWPNKVSGPLQVTSKPTIFVLHPWASFPMLAVCWIILLRILPTVGFNKSLKHLTAYRCKRSTSLGRVPEISWPWMLRCRINKVYFINTVIRYVYLHDVDISIFCI